MPSQPVQVNPSSNVYLNAIEWEGWRWSDGGNTPGTNITYYFGSSNVDLTGVFGSDVTNSISWASYERASYQSALQLWQNVANISFTQVSSYSQANLVEFITDDAGTALGIHETPESAALSDGTAWGVYERSGQGFTQTGLLAGGYGFATFVHELGHALGLAHPHDGGGDAVGVFPGVTPGAAYDLGDHNLNQAIFTTMSYVDGWNVLGPSPSYNYGWQNGPMAFDIAAIQYLYGANTSYHSGDNTYILGAANTTLSCIWDTGGTDEISYSGTFDCTIDLHAATLTNSVGGGGYVSYVNGAPASSLDHWSAFTIANGVVIENVATGSGDDQIVLTSEDVDNVIDGGEGFDTVVLPYIYTLWDHDDFSVDVVASSATRLVIDGWAGRDTFDNIERVQFADGTEMSTSSFILHHYEATSTVSISDVRIAEGFRGTSLATFTVTRSGGGTDAFDVRYATSDGTATAAGGDYMPASGILHFGAGINSQTISVVIYGDRTIESDESFAVRLFSPTNGATLGDNTGVAIIANDDTTAPEIQVTANGADIANGNTAPDLTHLTDFGTVVQGTTAIHTFTVTNIGGSDLLTSGLKLPKGFVLVEGLSATIAAGASDSFQVALDTSKIGTISGQISFTTNDSDEKKYNFYVAGSVVATPVNGDDTNNVLFAKSGADSFFGMGGDDTVSYDHATSGVTASLAGARGTGFATGDTYDSVENLTGSRFADRLTGNDADNTLEGGAGGDALDGGTGIDTASYAHAASGVTADLSRSANNTGEAFGDKYRNIENLLGSNHDDHLIGDKGGNFINGGDGNDEIAGGLGADILSGGSGHDTFRFNSFTEGADTILDFVSGEDYLEISRSGFKIDPHVATGISGAFDFALHYFVSNATGTATETGHGQFVFNQTTHELFWDADGAGADSHISLLTFKTDVTLLASDFHLI